MYSGYMDDVPSILVSLYLGPLSGKKDSVPDNLKLRTSYFNFQWLFRFWEKTDNVGSVLGPYHLRNAYDSYLYLPSLGRQVNFLRKK